MKTIRRLLGILFLLAASNQCFALWELEILSKARAKELGVELRSKSIGKENVGVWLEFKAKGELKEFSHVALEIISEGKKLVSASVQPSRQTEDGIVVFFSTHPTYLLASTLTIFSGNGEAGGVGYQIAVKDLVGK